MKKDIEWLKEAVGELNLVDTVFEADGVSYINTAVSVMEVYDLIDQLDDTEVTLDKAFDKVAESYAMTKVDVCRHLEQIDAYGGKVTYGEPKVLSQEWIDNHKESRINNLRKRTTSDVVPIDDLQNLIIPKQEITEEQVMNWLDKNDFYDHITAETVLERAVDKGELSYYGTKYSVIEAPTIPKYVAEFLELVRSDVSLMLILEVASTRRERSKWEKEYDWISENDEVFARAWLDGYEVEEEPLYYALIKGHELVVDQGDWTFKYWKCDTSSGRVFPNHRLMNHDDYLIEMSKAEWNKLGINDSNADFVKVKEMEE